MTANNIIKHPKIERLSLVPDILSGKTLIQEKVDGSQFSFGIDFSGDIFCRSKNKIIDLDNPENLFAPAVEYIKSKESQIKFHLGPGDVMFAETLCRPKHNTIVYDRVPINNIMLFAAYIGRNWASLDTLELGAREFGVELISSKYLENPTFEDLQRMILQPSILGGMMEGVVVKDYTRCCPHQQRYGILSPMMAKLVRPEFSEMNHKNVDHRVGSNGQVKGVFMQYNNTSRWIKAVMRMKEEGTYTGTLKDIGKLIPAIQKDILDEESTELGKQLLKIYMKDFQKQVTIGFVDWYKNQLLVENKDV